METLFHIKTGGTIGGCVPEYPEIQKVASVFGDTVNLDKYIQQSFKLLADYRAIEVCHKDSREITDDDRSVMAELIRREYNGGVKRFLITHGTYTMPETAQYLTSKLSKELLDDSMIVLTGSMYPWNVLGSDAPMNLGATLALLMDGTHAGVFICMHGKLFTPEHVAKDEENLIFVEK